MSLSNFERKKAGKLELEIEQIFEAGKLEECARKFEFLEILCYNKRLGIKLGAQVSLKYGPKFDKEINAGRLDKI